MNKTRIKPRSEYLSKRQVTAIHKAAYLAYDDKTPLNRHFTIHLEETDGKDQPQKAMTYLLDNTRKWLKYRGIEHAFLYVLENGKNKGIHAHLLLHIPSGYQNAYKKQLTKWAATKNITDIKPTQVQYPMFGDLHPLNGINKLLRYICKGINPNDNDNPELITKYQGKVYGRRWGTNLRINTPTPFQ